MPDPVAFALDVPIVGQPATCHEVIVAMVITCACTPTVPITIKGFGTVVACQRCRRQYMIGGLSWDGAARHLSINVGIVVGQPGASA